MNANQVTLYNRWIEQIGQAGGEIQFLYKTNSKIRPFIVKVHRRIAPFLNEYLGEACGETPFAALEGVMHRNMVKGLLKDAARDRRIQKQIKEHARGEMSRCMA